MARPKKETDEIEFFGEVDIIKGKQSSTYPAYYFEGLIREYEDRVMAMEKQLAKGQIPLGKVPQFKARLEQDKIKLTNIKNSKPHLSQAEQDLCHKVYKNIGAKISEQMPTRSDMNRGTTDAHIVARKMKEPCIALDNEMKKVASDMGVKIKNSKVSMDGAAKIFKIVGKLLDLPTNIEVLRKDVAHGTFKTEHDSVTTELRL